MPRRRTELLRKTIPVRGFMDWHDLLEFQDVSSAESAEVLGTTPFTIIRNVEGFPELHAGKICFLALRSFHLYHELEIFAHNASQDHSKMPAKTFHISGVCSLVLDEQASDTLEQENTQNYARLGHVPYKVGNSAIPALQDNQALATIDLRLYSSNSHLRVV